MTMMNRHLEPEVETVFLMTSLRFALPQLAALKEVANGGADIDDLVPQPVAEALPRRLRASRP